MRKLGPVAIGLLLLSLGVLFTLFVDFYSASNVLAFVRDNGTVWVSLLCLGPLISSASLYFFVRRLGVEGTAIVILPLVIYWYFGATAPPSSNFGPLFFFAVIVLMIFSPAAVIAGFVVRREAARQLRNR